MTTPAPPHQRQVHFADDYEHGMWWVKTRECPSPLRASLLIARECGEDDVLPRVRREWIRRRPALPHESEYDYYIEYAVPRTPFASEVWMHD